MKYYKCFKFEDKEIHNSVHLESVIDTVYTDLLKLSKHTEKTYRGGFKVTLKNSEVIFLDKITRTADSTNSVEMIMYMDKVDGEEWYRIEMHE